MTNDNHMIFIIFDRLSRKLPTRKTLKLYLCNQYWVDLSGMHNYVFVLFSASVNFNKFSFYYFHGSWLRKLRTLLKF